MRQRNREHLIRTAFRIVSSAFPIDDVVEVSTLREPEPIVERLADAIGALPVLGRRGVAFFDGPAFHQTQRVVPERVDFDRFASPRRHHPVVDLGVHPRELISLRALRQQPVAFVDVDAETRAADVMIDDVLELRVQQRERQPIARALDVAIDGVEEPQRRIGRVVQPFLPPFRKHVGNQTVSNVVGERAQDESRFDLAAGHERQPFKADHGVTAPVGEPVVAGDNRAHFVAERVRARRFLGAAGRRDDELIGGEHELGFGIVARGRHRLCDEPLAALPVSRQRLVRLQHVHRRGRFGRRDERGAPARLQHEAEVTGTP